jgi:protein-serine/threonine kinase
MSANKNLNGNSHFPQKLKNFFRLNGQANKDQVDRNEGVPKSESKTSFRQSKFFPTINRNRSTTVASEGNTLDEGISPTAHANPYFAHQGPPAIRHYNAGSVPSSPPDSPSFSNTGANDHATTAGKEELARKLRKVASAPNVQGLFSKKNNSGDRPATAELGKEPLAVNKNLSMLTLVDSKNGGANGSLAAPNGQDSLGALQPPNRAAMFRRTYSSNSIKIRNVEVGPGSFDKIKLIGKGDVGKVYLVREKKSTRLYAMKGMHSDQCPSPPLTNSSLEQERDDQAQQDKTGTCRARNPGHQQPPFYRDAVPLLPIRRPSLPVYGILQWWRILQSIADSTWKMHTRGRC